MIPALKKYGIPLREHKKPGTMKWIDCNHPIYRRGNWRIR